jgi:hypothetical protein
MTPAALGSRSAIFHRSARSNRRGSPWKPPWGVRLNRIREPWYYCLFRTPEDLRSLLDQARPVAVLVEPGWWARAQAMGVTGTVLPTEADPLPARRRSRAPVLVINREPRKVSRDPRARPSAAAGRRA